MIARSENELAPIGRVVATELKPSTPHQFHFWTATETSIGIGAIIKVGGQGAGDEGRVVYGVVTDGFAYSDLATPLHDFVGAEGDPCRAADAPTARQEIRYWTAAVLRQTPEEPLQPVPLGQVYLAADADVAQALRMDAFLYSATPTAIPVGLYTSAGRDAPVYLDADFLLGPEAAHLNISGVSGLATKTSAVEFLLGSIFAHYPAHKGRIAAVCFNVKGPDLCFLDQPADLSDEDRHRYQRLDVPATPLERVRYYAPLKADGVNLNTLRTHPDLVGDVEPLTWGLQEVVDYAEVLLNRDDIDAKADAFIDFLKDRVLGRTFDDGFGGTHRVQTFGDLDRLFRSIFDGLEIASGGRERHLAHASHRDDAQSAQPAAEHLDALQGTRHGRRAVERSAVECIRGSDRLCDRHRQRGSAGPGPGLRPRGVQAPRAARAPRARRRRGGRVRGRAEQVCAGRRLRHLRQENAARYLRARPLSRAGAVRRRTISLAGAPPRGGKRRNAVVRAHGHGRARDSRISGPQSRHQEQARHAADRRADGPPSAFHSADFRPLPQAAGAARSRRGRALPPAADVPFEDAVVRQLVRLDRRVRPNQVKDLIADREADDVRRALAAVRRTRPDDVLAYFRKALGHRVTPQAPVPQEQHAVPPLNPDQRRAVLMRALLLVLLVAACQKDAGPKIALRYHPPTGAVYHYALGAEHPR